MKKRTTNRWNLHSFIHLLTFPFFVFLCFCLLYFFLFTFLFYRLKGSILGMPYPLSPNQTIALPNPQWIRDNRTIPTCFPRFLSNGSTAPGRDPIIPDIPRDPIQPGKHKCGRYETVLADLLTNYHFGIKARERGSLQAGAEGERARERLFSSPQCVCVCAFKNFLKVFELNASVFFQIRARQARTRLALHTTSRTAKPLQSLHLVTPAAHEAATLN